jgi:hypothetical protein
MYRKCSRQADSWQDSRCGGARHGKIADIAQEALVHFDIFIISVKVVLKGNGSKGLWPQLVCCAPFPSIAQYFRMLRVSYPKIRMAIGAYPKVRTTIVWYPGVEESNVFLSKDKE